MNKLLFTYLFVFKLKLASKFSISHIRDKYDTITLQQYRNLERTNIKLAKIKANLIFLLKCQAFGITPKYLRFKLYKHSLEKTTLYKSWLATLLNLEIKDLNNQQNIFSDQLRIHSSKLRNMVTFLDYMLYLRNIKLTTNKTIDKINITHNKKLNALDINPDFHSIDPDKVIHNFSDRTLTNREKFLLSFGLEFCLPIHKPKFNNHYLQYETLAERLKTHLTFNTNFDKVTETIKQSADLNLKNSKPLPIFNNFFNKQDLQLLKNLSKNINLIITRPDKGRGVVILNKKDYIDKVTAVISDTTKFTPLDINTDIYKLSIQLEDKNNRFLSELEKKKVITSYQYKTLYASGSTPGVMYGLPKIHKQNIPTRPVLAAYNTASFKLAKFLVPILQPFTIGECSIKNSYDFFKEISRLSLPSEFHLASFDVVSLFTNIPLNETIDIIIKKAFSDHQYYYNFNKAQLQQALSIASKDIHFSFNQIIYKQIDGVAMGSPLGPTLANIFLNFHENIWLLECPLDFKPIFYRRYVDDTFLIFKSKAHIPLFLQYLNIKHQNIQFTSELETDNSISFLDMKLHKTDLKLLAEIYRKPTFSGLGVNFLNNCSLKFKINAVKTLLFRAYHLSSNWDMFHREVQFLANFFKQNSFPFQVFYDECKKFLNKIFEPPPVIHTAQKLNFFHVLPYYNPNSQNLHRKLERTLTVK